ncbi:unnamed protein product [Closterium sp. NIES-65]|nr:unnamed protein product [Closterium sp. NIES-65]
MQRAALSAPVLAQPLAALMPSPLTGLPGPASGSATGCLTAMLVGSACGTQEQEYLDACIDVLGSITNTNNTDNCGKHSGKDNGAPFLDTPMAHVLLAGSLLAMPLASGPHAEGPAAPRVAPRAAGTALPEWAVEQGGTGEGGAEGHRQQQFLGQEGMLAQGKPCQGSRMHSPIQPRLAMLHQPFPTGGAPPALCSPILPPWPDMTVTSGGDGMP